MIELKRVGFVFDAVLEEDADSAAFSAGEVRCDVDAAVAQFVQHSCQRREDVSRQLTTMLWDADLHADLFAAGRR